MSEGPKFLLPTQKGTTLWPQATQQPPILHIPGTEHDPELRQQVIADFAGRIGNFHVKASQAHALSGNAITRQHMAWPDGKLTYTNVQGQETLQLDVHPDKLNPRKPWDWAQIDIRVHNINVDITHAFFTAYLVSPQLAAITAGATEPFPGVAANRDGPASDGSEKPKIQFAAETGTPYPFLGVLNDAGTDQIASLLVDLREWHTFEEIRVDLYGNLVEPDGHYEDTPEIIASELNGRLDWANSIFGSTPLFFSTTTHTQADWVALYPELAGVEFHGDNASVNPTGYTDAQIADPSGPLFSAPVDGGISYSFTWIYDGNPADWSDGHWRAASPGQFGDNPATFEGMLEPRTYAQVTGNPANGAFTGTVAWKYWFRQLVGSGDTTAPMPTPPVDGVDVFDTIGRYRGLFSTYYYWPVHNTIWVPGSAASTCTITAAGFMGTPKWGVAEHDGPTVSSDRWEITTKYPDAVHLGQIADKVPIASAPDAGTGDLSVRKHMTFLGSLFFEQKTGAVIFKPA